MANNLHVVLKQDVAKLGRVGDLVRVKPGYARNFLLPRSLAVAATEGNVRQIEHEQKLALANAAKQKGAAQGVAAQFEGLSLELAAAAGEADRLFGSVTSRDVADALKKRGIQIDRKHLELPAAIKALGEYNVVAKLGSGVNATFKLVVVKAS